MGQGGTKKAIVVAAAVAVGSALSAVALPSESAPAVQAQEVDPCAGDGLRNSGFEAGPAGQSPTCWDVTQLNDRLRVVGTEGPSFSDIYAEKQITVVPPLGESMLALGNPRQQGESQAKNPDTVEQTFTATADAIAKLAHGFGDDIVCCSALSLKAAPAPKPTSSPDPEGPIQPFDLEDGAVIPLDENGSQIRIDQDGVTINAEIDGVPLELRLDENGELVVPRDDPPRD